MHKFNDLVKQYKILWRLGEEIINFRKNTKITSYPFSNNNKQYELQLSRIEEFDKLAANLYKKQKEYKHEFYNILDHRDL